VLTGASGDNPDGDGVAALLETVGDYVEYQFTLNYEWPAQDWDVEVRYAADDAQISLETTLDGNVGTGVSGGTGGDLFWLGAFGAGENDATLSPGTYTVRIELTDNPNNGDAYVDVVAPYDTRFSYNFDNSVTTTANGDYLDGPELYPDVFELAFNVANTRRDVTEANISSTWNDVSNNQYVELAIIDDQFSRSNNSQTASVTVSESDADTSVQSNAGLSRYGSRSETTPLNGFNNQIISGWELTGNPAAITPESIGEATTRGIVPPNTTETLNETLQECGIFGNGSLLTREIFAAFEVSQNERVASDETTFFNGE
jgi:hypothetical protein